MLAKPNRFHGYGSLRFVYANGKIVRGPMMSLKYSLNPKRKTFRSAVVVSKKVDKSAVVRNRLRRRVYEEIRQHSGKINQPYDMIFTVFNDQLDTISAKKLNVMVHAQLKQAGII